MLNSNDEQETGIYLFRIFCSHLILPNIRHLLYSYLRHEKNVFWKQWYQLKVKPLLTPPSPDSPERISEPFHLLSSTEQNVIISKDVSSATVETSFSQCVFVSAGRHRRAGGRLSVPGQRHVAGGSQGVKANHQHQVWDHHFLRGPFLSCPHPTQPDHTRPHPWASPCLTPLSSSPLSCAFHCDTLGRTPPALRLFPLTHRLRFQLKTTPYSRLWLNTFQKYVLPDLKLSNLLLLATFFLPSFLCMPLELRAQCLHHHLPLLTHGDKFSLLTAFSPPLGAFPALSGDGRAEAFHFGLSAVDFSERWASLSLCGRRCPAAHILYLDGRVHWGLQAVRELLVL